MGADQILLLIAVIADLVIGVFVLIQKPRSYTNRFFLLFTLASAVWSIANYLSLHQNTPEYTLTFARWVLFFATFYSLFLFLTVHTLPFQKIRLKPLPLILISLFTLIVLFLTQSPWMFVAVTGSEGVYNVTAGPAISLFALNTGFFILGSIYILIYRLRHSSGVVHAQLQYLLLGIVSSSLLIFITNFVFVILLRTTAFLFLAPVYTFFFIVATAYSIIAHHLFDIRVIIKRALVYSGLLFATLATYSMIIFALTSIIGRETVFDIKSFASNMFAAILISFGFGPLRRSLEDRTDKFLFQKEYQEQQVLQSLAKNLNDVVALDEALEIMMQTIVKVLHLHHAATFVFQPAENNQMAIKRIKQIGYSSTTHLFMHEDDFCIPFFTANPKILSVDDFKQEIDDEKVDIERLGKQSSRHQNPEASQLIRQHAIKQAVLKKLQSLEASLVIPLHLDATPLGLIILSEKLAGNVFTTEDMNLLETIGAQAIASIQKAKLYEGDQMKSEFVSIASHELLTPISAIEGYLSMILDENIGHVDKQAREYLSKVYTSSRRLSQLIKDLLSVSRIESGKLKIDLQSLDMEKMINDTLDQLKFVASDKNLHIEYLKPKSPLPPVWADPDRVMQVLVNLVSNAIKYTPKGSVTITASVIHHPQPLVKVDVTDTGMGMSKQAQSHLFEKFYRVDSPETTGIVGTGLGLYITKSIVEKMGGTILLKSEPGKGSTFSFTTPLFKVDNSSIS